MDSKHYRGKQSERINHVEALDGVVKAILLVTLASRFSRPRVQQHPPL